MKFKKEELLFDMPLYSIFMVSGDAWYVGNKVTKKMKRFDFQFYSYLDVINYAESIW